jgi:hypothetical protein
MHPDMKKLIVIGGMEQRRIGNDHTQKTRARMGALMYIKIKASSGDSVFQLRAKTSQHWRSGARTERTGRQHDRCHALTVLSITIIR